MEETKNTSDFSKILNLRSFKEPLLHGGGEAPAVSRGLLKGFYSLGLRRLRQSVKQYLSLRQSGYFHVQSNSFHEMVLHNFYQLKIDFYKSLSLAQGHPAETVSSDAFDKTFLFYLHKYEAHWQKQVGKVLGKNGPY